MRRFISIVFVVILLLNTMGYYGVFLGLHYQNDISMTMALDSNLYDESATLTLKVPLSLPYMMDQLDFERINGTFEHQGELYRLVKEKYAKGTLTVVCIKDIHHKKIDQALSDYVKTFTDHATDQKPSKISINFLKDYLPITFSIHSVSNGWSSALTHRPGCETLIPVFSASIVHPPERA